MAYLLLHLFKKLISFFFTFPYRRRVATRRLFLRRRLADLKREWERRRHFRVLKACGLLLRICYFYG